MTMKEKFQWNDGEASVTGTVERKGNQEIEAACLDSSFKEFS